VTNLGTIDFIAEDKMSRLEKKLKKSKRLQKDKAIIQTRVKVAKSHGMTKVIEQKNRLNKRHPLDCGKSNCGLCGSPRKLCGEKSIQEKKHEQKDKYEN